MTLLEDHRHIVLNEPRKESKVSLPVSGRFDYEVDLYGAFSFLFATHSVYEKNVRMMRAYNDSVHVGLSSGVTFVQNLDWNPIQFKKNPLSSTTVEPHSETSSFKRAALYVLPRTSFKFQWISYFI